MSIGNQDRSLVFLFSRLHSWGCRYATLQKKYGEAKYDGNLF